MMVRPPRCWKTGLPPLWSLYRSGKVEKLLMSGDNRFVSHNEPAAMLEYALQLGVPRQDIVLDYAGQSTYDTCYRARQIFGVTEALLVTQEFHLPRAVFTCNNLGLPAEGVIADRRRYVGSAVLRELPASLKAMWDVWVARPLPILGRPGAYLCHPHRVITRRAGPKSTQNWIIKSFSVSKWLP